MVNSYHKTLLSNQSELLIHTITSMNLQRITLNVNSQSQKATQCMIPFITALLKWQNYINGEQIFNGQELRRVSVGGSHYMKDPCGDGNIYLDMETISWWSPCTAVFTRRFHWGKLGKGYTEICLCYFLQLYVNLQWSKYKKFD